MIRRILAYSLFAFLLIHGAQATPVPGLTNQQLNILVAGEATALDLWLLVFTSPQPIQHGSLGQWTGSITDEGWQLNFSGRINGVPVGIQQFGNLGENDGVPVVGWRDTGFVGEEPITGVGRAIIDDVDFNQMLAVGMAGAGIATGAVAGQLLSCIFLSPIGCAVAGFSSPIITVMVGGSILASVMSDTTVTSRPDGSWDASTGASGSGISIRETQRGNPDGGVQIDAAVSNPEPASIALLVSALAGFVGLRLICRRRAV